VSMIVTTFNVRGLGGRVKRSKIYELVRQNKIDFLALQETKLGDITPSLCHLLWGSVDCDWALRPSEGSSGGILSIWDKSCDFNFYFPRRRLCWGVFGLGSGETKVCCSKCLF